MKLFNSLKVRFVFFFIIFIVTLTSVQVITGVRQMAKTVIEVFSDQGVRIVEGASSIIDGDSHEALTKSLNEDDPFYEEMRLKLRDLKELSGCVYLYTMAPQKGDDWLFIIDGSAEPDDEENFSALGDVQDTSDYDHAFKRVLTSGKTEISGLMDQGEWGWLISVYTPIKNSRGEIIGIVGCDFDGEMLRNSIVKDEIQQSIIGIISVVFGIFLLTYFMQMIFGPIKKMDSILKEISMGEGDLTRRISLNSKNEIGELAAYFDLTIEKIEKMVIVIKKEALNLADTGNALATNMNQTAAAINEITSNIKSVQKQIMSQSVSVNETHSTMEQVVVNINKLNNHVENQSENVSSASSAIEEMVANTQSVTETLKRNAANVKILKNSSEVGHAGLQEVAADIQEIARESEGLLSINAVMENISSQTNLLSMNAAIEAAHAGESGRGFAVVAGEIRKLAENSSKQSKTISVVLKKIKTSIDKITHSTEKVMENFKAIDESIQIVSEQEDNIRNSMEEQQTGSKQILDGISNVREITRHVKNGANEMLDGSKEVIRESGELEKATQQIADGMHEMAFGAEEVNLAVHHIQEISRNNRENISVLGSEVAKFKVAQ